MKMKFKVDNPEQNERLQKELFRAGYNWEWHSYNNSFTWPNAHTIYVDEDYNIYIGVADDEKPEYTLMDTERFINGYGGVPVGRTVSMEEAMDIMVAAGGTRVENRVNIGDDVINTALGGKVVSDGGSSDYYKITVNTKDGSFECETKDIIYALVGGDFDLGNALKALRRIYEASQGRGKDGITMEYDAKKISFFVEDFLERFGEQV